MPFHLVNEEKIEELQATLQEYEHESGARVIHIGNDDPENLFCIGLKTHPTSSDGAAHILEHTVLCGSEKYPVKDPFFAMTRRSLNTFMNAMTGSDATFYPASSQVKKDYFNLFSVYIDAVFHPLLKEMSFLQEGHRLEMEGDKVVRKGIVYNEMKGALSSPDARLWDAVTETLMPDLPYAYNSGGTPKEITTLTYEGLKAFHEKFYHPSQALFFTYGNIPVEENLAFIEKEALEGVEKREPIAPIPRQPRFAKPVVKSIPYPASKDDKAVVVQSWLTTPIEEVEDQLALMLIDSVLTDTDASPLKKALLESGLCSQVDAYFDCEMRENPYIVVARGCEAGSAEKIQGVIFDTLKNVVISAEMARSSLHQIELHRLEITGDREPFGLTLFMRAALPAQHGCSPANALRIYSHFKTLEKRIEEPSYLKGMIDKYLVNNPHAALIVMEPDVGLVEREKKEEEAELAKLSVDKEKLVKMAKELEEFQDEEETPESLSVLPSIGLEDVPGRAANYPLIHHAKVGILSPYHHNAFTNHFAYIEAMLELPKLDEEKLMTAELMVSLLPELGCGKRGYADTLAYLHKYTGGLSAYFTLQTVYGGEGAMRPVFSLRGKALSRHIPELFAIFRDYFVSSRFDEKERIKQLILQMATNLRSRFTRHAMSYAIGTSLSGHTLSNYLHEALSGLKYYRYLIDLADNIDVRLPLLLEEFALLKELLFHGHALDLVITCDENDYRTMENNRYFGLADMPQKSFHPFEPDFVVPQNRSHATEISAAVAYTATSLATTAAPNLDAPALHLAAKLMTHKVLHKRIREQGGAYGAGASYSPVTGNFYMTAYRDPNIESTLSAFGEAIRMIENRAFTKDDLKQAKLSLIQSFDDPIAPGSRGITAYHWIHTDRTLEERQKYRDALLRMTTNCVKNAVEKHLTRFVREGTTSIFAGRELLQKERVDLPIEQV